MKKNHVVIVSKDRAAQAELCLVSLIKNANWLFDKVTLLYVSSTLEFEKGYHLLHKRMVGVYEPYWLEFRKEMSFKEDILETVNVKEYDYTCFLTDDLIIYRKTKVTINEIETAMETPNVGCITLRLGNNTVIQDQYNGQKCTMPQSVGFIENTPFVYWNWKEIPRFTNFAYPLSVDGHIFKTPYIVDVMKNTDFFNPNSLEGNWQKHVESCPKLMCSLPNSIIVNTPLNRVQDTAPNKAGEWFGMSAKDMNTKYLNNLVIDLNNIDFSGVRGCHQELEMPWKPA